MTRTSSEKKAVAVDLFDAIKSYVSAEISHQTSEHDSDSMGSWNEEIELKRAIDVALEVPAE